MMDDKTRKLIKQKLDKWYELNTGTRLLYQTYSTSELNENTINTDLRNIKNKIINSEIQNGNKKIGLETIYNHYNTNNGSNVDFDFSKNDQAIPTLLEKKYEELKNGQMKIVLSVFKTSFGKIIVLITEIEEFIDRINSVSRIQQKNSGVSPTNHEKDKIKVLIEARRNFQNTFKEANKILSDSLKHIRLEKEEILDNLNDEYLGKILSNIRIRHFVIFLQNINDIFRKIKICNGEARNTWINTCEQRYQDLQARITQAAQGNQVNNLAAEGTVDWLLRVRNDIHIETSNPSYTTGFDTETGQYSAEYCIRPHNPSPQNWVIHIHWGNPRETADRVRSAKIKNYNERFQLRAGQFISALYLALIPNFPLLPNQELTPTRYR